VRKKKDEKKVFECRECGRTFKSGQALGGHVMRVHGKQQSNIQPTTEKPDEEKAPQLLAPPSEGASEAEQIRYYCQQGLTYEDLAKRGVKDTTVRQEIAKMLIRNRQTVEANQVESLLPVVLKDGKGEAISPEAVYYQLVAEDGIDGERDFKALMRWAASIELVQRMVNIRKGESEAVAKMFEPVLEMMEKSRQELDAAAARNQESMTEVAMKAGSQAGAMAMEHIDQRFNQMQERKKDIAEVQDPMKGLMARTMESMMQRMQGMMFGGGQGGQDLAGPTPGMVDRRGQQGG
jgi:hypothetical protein